MSDPTTTLRLPAPLRARLVRYAKVARTSQSAIMIQALDEYLARTYHAQHVEAVNRELQRLTRLERESKDLREFHGPPDEDPWGDA